MKWAYVGLGLLGGVCVLLLLRVSPKSSEDLRQPHTPTSVLRHLQPNPYQNDRLIPRRPGHTISYDHFTTGLEDQQEPSVLQGLSDDTIILPVEFSPLMTSSQFDSLIRGPISIEQDKTRMDDVIQSAPSVATRQGDVLQPTPSVATRQGDVLQPTPSVATKQEGVPGPSRTDIVHDAAVFAGLQIELYSSQEDEICSKAQPSDPPTNAPLGTYQSPPLVPFLQLKTIC